jgi:hypothetical protein
MDPIGTSKDIGGCIGAISKGKADTIVISRDDLHELDTVRNRNIQVLDLSNSAKRT